MALIEFDVLRQRVRDYGQGEAPVHFGQILGLGEQRGVNQVTVNTGAAEYSPKRACLGN